MRGFFVLLIFVSFGAQAQYEVLPFGDVQRTPIKEIKYTDVTGSPYLYDFWVKGKVTLQNGKKYITDSLKYNVIDEKLIFKNNDGSLMYFAEPVKEFELYGTEPNPVHFINGLPAINGLNSNSYYQVIATGKIGLLKKVSKNITELKQYGSAVTNKAFNTTYSYYSFQNGTLTKITPNKKTIIALFGIKEDLLNDFLKKEKVDFKKDEDLYKLFTYLNY
ncbi:hypothetical protein [Pedobacter rhodius]|uniref:DKNYY family protein n=1 Tax=Pedobacter rhodius TaxID=3004098 RepID=A0ABT4L442_9SPHI|nr:hypothetical protein [Pedobacter sp. SJ11]MCZ4225182.1 hypothetical protein [Pedobacter sp. SJ11]